MNSTPFLSIEDGKLILTITGHPGPSNGYRFTSAVREEIRSTADLIRLGVTDFYVSSSIDYPEEHTDNPDVIRLAKELRR